jgi:hypothetical protein
MNFSNRKNRLPLPPGFSLPAPSYIIRVPKDKKSLACSPGARVHLRAWRLMPRHGVSVTVYDILTKIILVGKEEGL